MKTIGLLITAYEEHKRLGKLQRAAEIAFADERIRELVVWDDSGDGSDGMRHFSSVCAEFRRRCPAHLKLVTGWNQKNRGVFGNKLAAIRASRSAWVQSLDSDNHFGAEYLDTLFAIEWLPHLMISPSYAAPEFDYREKSGHKITLSNAVTFFEWPRACCLLNTGNQFFYQPGMLTIMANAKEESFHLDQPDYFHAGPNLEEVRWRKVYDAGDSFYFNKRWLEAGNEILVAPGLTYQHEVHKGSSWQAAPPEKEILTIIYAMELIDRANDISAGYVVEGIGPAYSVRPPLPVQAHERVVVMRRRTGDDQYRIWVRIVQPRILRSVKL